MEEEEWTVEQLEVFAAAYVRLEDLYIKPSSAHTYSSEQEMKQHEQRNKAHAMKQLAESLVLPNEATSVELCSEFRRQLLYYVSSCVRGCLSRNEHYKRALETSFPNIAKLANKLDLPEVVFRAELSRRDSPSRRWAVDALTMKLCSAIRSHYGALGTRPEDLPSDALAAASVAVFSDAKHLTKDLWVRICSLRKQQLLKMSQVGDRGDLLQPSERLQGVDWQLVDELLMYTPDDAMILTAESLLHWRELLRALTLLVELLVAVRARRPAPLVPRARRTPLWKTVHKAYTDTGRTATVVLLQRRWQQLLRLARAVHRQPPRPHPPHPLLVLVAASFPQVISKKDVSWQTLVQHGLVTTTEDIKRISMNDKLTLRMDFTQLERCKTTNHVVLYITSKLECEHKIHYNDIYLKGHDYINTVIVHSSENNDCELENGCNNLKKLTDSPRSLNDTDERTLENTIHSNHTITLDNDSEAVDKVNKQQDKPTENKQYFEIEIDTSKIVDYVSDMLMEVGNLKTLDDLENPLGDLDSIESYKIMKDSKVKAESNTEFIKCEDDNASNNLIEKLKTEQHLSYHLPRSTMLDPKLFSMPRVKLKRLDETKGWQRHARLNSIDVNNYKSSGQNIRLLKMAYLSESSTESEEEIDGPVKYCYDKKSRNPDLNPVLKRLTKRCWKKNRRLLKLCKPALVRVHRLRKNEWPGGGRMVKRVKLPNIDEVRRINRNILTAQVEPIHVQNEEVKVSVNGEKATTQQDVKAARAALQSTRELADSQLADDVLLLQVDLEELFAVPPPAVDHLATAPKQRRSGTVKEVTKTYSRRYRDWLAKESAHHIPLLRHLLERDQQTIIKDKSLEVDAKNFQTETEDDLDNMLRCTIIKKPRTYADKPETDVATQPFFVSSNEKLVASNFESTTPVITEICSLAEKDTLLVNDRTSHPTASANPSHFQPLTVKKSSQPSHDINTTQKMCVVNVEDGTVLTKPRNFTIQINPIQKMQDESSQSSTFSLPKQYERFSDPANELASLTPVTVRGAQTSTFTLVDAQQTFTSAYINSLPEIRKQSVITKSPTSHILPILTSKMPTNDPRFVTLMTPSISNTQQRSGKTPQLVPTPTTTAPMTSHVVRNAPGQLQAITSTTPKLSTNTTQLQSTLTMTSPMKTTSQMPVTNESQTMPELLRDAAAFNVIGYKLDGEIKLHAEENTTSWVEPGRIEPPSALTLYRFLTPKDYIYINSKFNLTVVKLDPYKPLWTVANKYMILADINLACAVPTYWTLGSPENCSKLVWPKSVNVNTPVNVKKAQEMNASSIVIENVVGNYPIHELHDGTDLDTEMKDGEVTVVNVSDSDVDDGERDGQRATASMLRVNSFAKCERKDSNALEPEKDCRDIIKHGGRYFKKLIDNPLRYSLMLSSVWSTEECDGLLRDRVPLHVWDRQTGALSPLEVTDSDPDQVPARMAGALVIRHADGRFLKDMALKFQQLNSSNARYRENQIYMFAPQAGTLLVASPKDIRDVQNANLSLQYSGNS